ncbi:MAG TPA: VOC family protein [Rhizomicrobium sp.]
MAKPIFRKIDCYLLKASDLGAAVDFYGTQLGLQLLWRNDSAAGFALPESDAEVVVHTKVGPETDLLVDDVREAYARLLAAGATGLQAPFEIAIGLCAVVKDPFGNVLTILDQSKGQLHTDAAKNVIGLKPRAAENTA